MEADGFFHYPERLCLVQMAAAGRILIVDPLALGGLDGLGPVLADRRIEKVLHGCDYDLRSFDRDFGFHFANIFDTQTAISLLEPSPMGLGNALRKYLGVDLKKPVKLQRSDWSRRPLPREALDYAASDAAHLFHLRDALRKLLAEKGREGWAAEEFALLEGIRFEPPEPPEMAAFGAKGAFDLDPRELAIFRELYLFRDAEARRLDRPPFKVVSDEVLMDIARNPDRPLSEVRRVNERWIHEAGRKIREAVARGKNAGPLLHPSRLKPRRKPWDDVTRARVKRLQQARAHHATELNIGPSVLWPMRSLERIASEPEAAWDEISGHSEHGVRKWQVKEFGAVLENIVREYH